MKERLVFSLILSSLIVLTGLRCYSQSAIPPFSDEEKNLHNNLKMLIFSYPLKERGESLLLDITTRSVAVAFERAGFKTVSRSVRQMKAIVSSHDYDEILPLLVKHAGRTGADFIALCSYSENGETVNFKVELYSIEIDKPIDSVEGRAGLNLDFDNAIESAVDGIIRRNEESFRRVANEKIASAKLPSVEKEEPKGSISESVNEKTETAKENTDALAVAKAMNRFLPYVKWGWGVALGSGVLLPVDILVDYTNVLATPVFKLFVSRALLSNYWEFGITTGSWLGMVDGSSKSDFMILVPVHLGISYSARDGKGRSIFIGTSGGGDIIMLLNSGNAGSLSIDYISVRPGFGTDFGFSIPISGHFSVSLSVNFSMSLENGRPLMGLSPAILFNVSG